MYNADAKASVAELFRPAQSNLDVRAIHVDLKGCVPTFSRLLRQLELYAAAKFNAVLIEWEDMFPWDDVTLRASYAYTPEEIHRLDEACQRLGIEIIPLVQSLGHMENVLEQPQYRELQEMKGDHCCLDPMNPKSVPLVISMIDNVLRLLPNVRRFHLGGDEASTLGQAPHEADFVKEHGIQQLYLNHITPLTRYLRERGVIPMLWADMMAHWNEDALKAMATEAELVAWGYQGKVTQFRDSCSRERLQTYVNCGITLWGGCAFKGADGSCSELPNLENRCENTLDWVQAGLKVPFKGIIATGWSRYSTTRPQCEITDGALQSVVMAGAMLYNGDVQEEDKSRALALIAELGEEEHHEKLVALLKRFSEIFASHWFLLKEHTCVALSRQTQRLSGSDWYIDFYVNNLKKNLSDFRALKEEFMALMDGYMVTDCAEAYFRERELVLESNLQRARELAEQLAH